MRLIHQKTWCLLFVSIAQHDLVNVPARNMQNTFQLSVPHRAASRRLASRAPVSRVTRFACHPRQEMGELPRDERRVVVVGAMAGVWDQHHLAGLREDEQNQHAGLRASAPAHTHFLSYLPTYTHTHIRTHYKLPATATCTCCFAAHACSIPAALELFGQQSQRRGQVARSGYKYAYYIHTHAGAHIFRHIQHLLHTKTRTNAHTHTYICIHVQTHT